MHDCDPTIAERVIWANFKTKTTGHLAELEAMIAGFEAEITDEERANPALRVVIGGDE